MNPICIYHGNCADGMAKEMGFVKEWNPGKGTYYPTAICTPKGRIFVKNNSN